MANDDLILEILKRMQADLSELKRPVGRIETRLAAHDDHLSGLLIATTGVQSELRHLNARVDRIERRLDLVDA